MTKALDLGKLLGGGYQLTTPSIADSAITTPKIATGANADKLSVITFPITGNISANTWYTLTDAGLFGRDGIAHVGAYSNTAGYGGDHYQIIADFGSIPVKSRTTNDYSTFSLDTPKYVGHAANTQRYTLRIVFQGGNPTSPLIQWQSNMAMSGLTSGVLTFYVHLIIGY
jgi:hypothetical protein